MFIANSINLDFAILFQRFSFITPGRIKKTRGRGKMSNEKKPRPTNQDDDHRNKFSQSEGSSINETELDKVKGKMSNGKTQR